MQLSNLRRVLSILLLNTLALSVTPAWPAFPAAGYFPLPDGATWNYIDSFSAPYSNRVSGTVDIKGIVTKRLLDINGDSQYFTNDANGIRMHAIGTAFASTTTSFIPPIPMVNATANIGDRLVSSGLAEMYIPGYGTYPLNYNSSATIVAAEQVSVPFGTFDTVRFVLTFTLQGSVNGTPVYETATSTLWLAPGIGVVKDDEAEYGVLQLVDTNVASLLPAVTIDFPASGATLTRNFNLQFTISNWTVAPGDSHFHWFLDGADQGPRYDRSPIPASGLDNGPHSISLRLTNADHTYTGVEDTVTFTFDKSPSGAAVMGIISTILLSD